MYADARGGRRGRQTGETGHAGEARHTTGLAQAAVCARGPTTTNLTPLSSPTLGGGFLLVQGAPKYRRNDAKYILMFIPHRIDELPEL